MITYQQDQYCTDQGIAFKALSCSLLLVPGFAQMPDTPMLQWLLGFIELPENEHCLLRHKFPSKVGGRPVECRPPLNVVLQMTHTATISDMQLWY